MGGPLKHRWSLSHNYLAGLTAGTWRRLLRDNRPAIDAAYAHRALFITLASLANSIWARHEMRRFADAVARTDLSGAPLFILGHWRSGTTFLHELLAQDSEQFAFPNTYQVVNPLTFLTTEETNARRFARLLPEQRPMDNMKLSFQSPQEDEFAPCLMTLASPYLGISFPRRESHYDRYLTFRQVPPDETKTWQQAFLWFAKKITYKYQRPLLFKSPPHTARLRILLDLFPEARFVHIHRHPYQVFPSFQHYFDTAAWYTYLQKPDLTRIDDRIIHRYAELYGAFFEDLPRIPPGRFCEVAFADLEQDPLGEVGRIYETLGLEKFSRFEPVLRHYVNSVRDYQKNQFAELDAGLRRRLATAWQPCFERWNYPI